MGQQRKAPQQARSSWSGRLLCVSRARRAKSHHEVKDESAVFPQHMAGFDAELGNGESMVGTDSLMSFPPGLRSATSRAQLAAESRSGSKGNLSSMSVHSIGGVSDYCEPLAGDPLIADSVDSILEPGDQAPNPLTKVVCTIGGSARSVDTLSDMLTAGMSVARIDLSWGSRSYHQHTLHNLRSAMQRTKRLCAVMLDTKGPETQVVLGSDEGSVCESDESTAPSALSIAIDAGSTVVLQSSLPEASQPLELLEASSSQQMLSETQRPPSANGNFHNNNCNNNTASSNSRSTSSGGDDNTILLRVNNSRLPQLVQPGDEVFVGQYLASGFEGGSAFLEVENATASQVRCRAVNSARIGGVLLTVHVRGLEEGVQCIHEQEVEDIAKLAAPNSIEFISLSFTSSAADVQQARALLSHHGLPHCRVVAKVEGQEAVSNLEEIVTAADGVMLSRGNLGLELHPEKVFLAQKYALRMCNQLGKPCIVTRVVDTLVESPSPTRAEATDVANACLDGTDAILLGAETIRGLYPVQSVKTVLSICSEAEKVFNADHFFRRNVSLSQDEESGMQHAEALASSAVRAAYKIAAKLIVVFTQTGNTARMVSKYRPYQPVLCVVVPSVSRESTKWVIHGSANARQLLINRNLTPFLAHFNTTSSPDAGTSQPGALSCALEHARSLGIASSGDRVVVCQKIGATSVVKIVEA